MATEIGYGNDDASRANYVSSLVQCSLLPCTFSTQALCSEVTPHDSFFCVLIGLEWENSFGGSVSMRVCTGCLSAGWKAGGLLLWAGEGSLTAWRRPQACAPGVGCLGGTVEANSLLLLFPRAVDRPLEGCSLHLLRLWAGPPCVSLVEAACSCHFFHSESLLMHSLPGGWAWLLGCDILISPPAL